MSKKVLWACIISLFVIGTASTIFLSLERQKGITTQGITFPKGTEFSFYPSGKLYLAHLPESYQIQGIHCSKDSSVEFYESGHIKRSKIISASNNSRYNMA